MTTLYKWDGKLLVRDGKLAIHPQCCCSVFVCFHGQMFLDSDCTELIYEDMNMCWGVTGMQLDYGALFDLTLGEHSCRPCTDPLYSGLYARVYICSLPTECPDDSCDCTYWE